MNTDRGRNIFVTTSMRTGSTWLCELVAGLLRTKVVFWKKVTAAKIQRRSRLTAPTVTKMHGVHPQTICAVFPNGSRNYVLNITRDIRDTIVSRLFFARYSKVAVRNRRRRFRQGCPTPVDLFVREHAGLPDREYLNRYIESCDLRPFFTGHMTYVTFSHPYYWRTSYEQLAEDTVGVLQGLCGFLELAIPLQRVQRIVRRKSFKRKTGREPGQGSNRQFRRKGIVGDHRNWLVLLAISFDTP